MRLTAFAAVALLLLAVPGSAQNTDIEALSGLQFNFGNPGARSLGMGGAFVGLADDASAAEANPAGLAILRKAEVSVELRNTTTSQTFVTGGTYPFPTSEDFPSRQKTVSFASFVSPVGPGVVALYYHRPLAFRNRVNVSERYGTPVYYLGPAGPITRDRCATTPGCVERLIYPFSTSADLKIETFGMAVSRQWGNFSVGGAVRLQRFEESADTFRKDLDAPGQPVFTVVQMNGGRVTGDRSNRAVAFVGGVKWAPSQRLSAGAVYKQGSSFSAPVLAGPAGQPLTIIGQTRFRVPSAAGAGVAYRPLPALTVTADVVRVAYSHLTNSFLSVIEYGAVTGIPEHVSGYQTKDGTEFHGGVEYFVLSRTPIALRAGWWRDPAHAIAYRGPVVTAEEVAARVLFPGAAAENHYSVGVGISLPRFEVDAAYDTSRTLSSASLSLIVRY